MRGEVPPSGSFEREGPRRSSAPRGSAVPFSEARFAPPSGCTWMYTLGLRGAGTAQRNGTNGPSDSEGSRGARCRKEGPHLARRKPPTPQSRPAETTDLSARAVRSYQRLSLARLETTDLSVRAVWSHRRLNLPQREPQTSLTHPLPPRQTFAAVVCDPRRGIFVCSRPRPVRARGNMRLSPVWHAAC